MTLLKTGAVKTACTHAPPQVAVYSTSSLSQSRSGTAFKISAHTSATAPQRLERQAGHDAADDAHPRVAAHQAREPGEGVAARIFRGNCGRALVQFARALVLLCLLRGKVVSGRPCT